MGNYIKESITKFKNEALSKGIYDLLKWLFTILVLLISTKWIPLINGFISKRYSISAYFLIIASLLLIIGTSIIVARIFRKQIRQVLNENHTDELTGLKNQKALNNYLNLKIKDAKDKSESLSLILIDIDNFKDFNTRNGFNTADQLLKKLGELLSNDKRVTDETFRCFNHGDEFLVVAYDTTLSQAIQAAERKRKLIQKNLFSVEEKNYQLTVCCGVTEFNKNDDNKSFTDRVANALIEAKKINGKNNTKSIV